MSKIFFAPMPTLPTPAELARVYDSTECACGSAPANAQEAPLNLAVDHVMH